MSIQNRLTYSLRFVELSTKNGKTYSYEYSSLLRDAGSVFTSVMDSLVKNIKDTKDNTSFSQYRKLLLEYCPDIFRVTVLVRHLIPNGMVVPFRAFSNPKGIPKWWTSFNNVKHLENLSYLDGNLASTVVALAGLVILEYFIGSIIHDDFWVNIGIKYHDDSIDMSPERRLFIDAE